MERKKRKSYWLLDNVGIDEEKLLNDDDNTVPIVETAQLKTLATVDRRLTISDFRQNDKSDVSKLFNAALAGKKKKRQRD